MSSGNTYVYAVELKTEFTIVPVLDYTPIIIDDINNSYDYIDKLANKKYWVPSETVHGQFYLPLKDIDSPFASTLTTTDTERQVTLTLVQFEDVADFIDQINRTNFYKQAWFDQYYPYDWASVFPVDYTYSGNLGDIVINRRT